MAIHTKAQSPINNGFVWIIITASLGLFGCHKNEAQTRHADLGTGIVAIGDQSIAQVNGTLITQMDVEREAATQNIIQPGASISPATPTYERIVDELIDQRLLAQEALKRKLDQDPEARTRLRIAREQILGNILVERVVADAVTDAAVKRLYEEQANLIEPSKEIKARHILVETEDEAKEIRARLVAGAEFAALAFETSKDAATRLEGGDLGYFTHESMLLPFADAAFALQDGEISKPIKTRYGWHIIKVESRRNNKTPELEEMRPRLVRFMTFDEIQKLVTDLRGKAQIKRIEIPITTPQEPVLDKPIAPKPVP